MEEVNEICITQFKDEFFRKMLETPLQEASLFKDRQSICDFLLWAANHYKSKLVLSKDEEKVQGLKQYTQKLNHEFDVICMLNALYGNPN